MFSSSINAHSLPASCEAILLQKLGGFYFPSALTVVPAPAAVATAVGPPLYSGKWTLEEEQYVTFLCHSFKAGSLDVPEGKSLRCFLAEQLGCNAKRISKKYERTGYNGKLQYVDRRSIMTAQDLAKIQDKLEVLKRNFQQSRETLKAVEASRKRNATAVPFEEPSQKRIKTALISPITTHLAVDGRNGFGTGMSLNASLAAGASTGINGIFGNPQLMNALLLRRSLFERGQTNAHSENLVGASMLATLQKHRAAAFPTIQESARPGTAAAPARQEKGSLTYSLAAFLARQRNLTGKNI